MAYGDDDRLLIATVDGHSEYGKKVTVGAVNATHICDKCAEQSRKATVGAKTCLAVSGDAKILATVSAGIVELWGTSAGGDTYYKGYEYIGDEVKRVSVALSADGAIAAIAASVKNDVKYPFIGFEGVLKVRRSLWKWVTIDKRPPRALSR
jgi:hypothetical protein